MRLFFVTADYTFRAMFHWLRPVPYVINRLLFPLVQLVFFALIGQYGGSQSMSFYLVGNAIGVATLSTFGVSQAVADERWQGTLSYLLGSPAPRVPVFFGRAAYHVVDGMLNMAAAFALAVVVFGLRLPIEGLAGLVLSMLVATIALCGVGLLLGALAYIFLDAILLANWAMFILLLLTGMNVPLSELPGFASAIGEALPLTRSIAAARLYAAGAPIDAGLGLLAGDLAIGAAYAVAGYVVFGWLELRSRIDGRLEGV
ncbi:MAG TPA: ABC transporter permease [Candidatus Limnocylindria bacterium]|nr:ABC transporter permease [Candidatus Limnocylindria bacterium]